MVRPMIILYWVFLIIFKWASRLLTFIFAVYSLWLGTTWILYPYGIVQVFAGLGVGVIGMLLFFYTFVCTHYRWSDHPQW